MLDNYAEGSTVILRNYHKATVIKFSPEGVIGTSLVQFSDGTSQIIDNRDIVRVETVEDLKGECS